jgi:hypothetical protein
LKDHNYSYLRPDDLPPEEPDLDPEDPDLDPEDPDPLCDELLLIPEE